jgi:hypothetical protein
LPKAIAKEGRSPKEVKRDLIREVSLNFMLLMILKCDIGNREYNQLWPEESAIDYYF